MSAKKEDVKSVTEFAVATTVPGFITHAEIISALRAKYAGVTYDVSTPTGMAKAVAARKELREAAEEAAKVKPLASGYSIVLKNAGKNRWVGLWLDEKDVEKYRTGKAHDTPAEALAMVEEFISGEGMV